MRHFISDCSSVSHYPVEDSLTYSKRDHWNWLDSREEIGLKHRNFLSNYKELHNSYSLLCRMMIDKRIDKLTFLFFEMYFMVCGFDRLTYWMHWQEEWDKARD